MSKVFPSRVSVMGVPIDPFTMDETVKKVCEFIDQRIFAHVIGVNADKYLQMCDSDEMDEIVRACELINADGASMLLAAKKLGVEIPERVAGIDLMYELCAVSAERGYKVFLLGATQQVVEMTREELTERYPGIRIVGMRDGYFNDGQFEEVALELSISQADIVFVGITSPKKERLIESFREKGLRGVFVGVGGSFDVISGNIPRAPKWMQRANMEWIFRLIQEPRRLFLRYVVGNTRFIVCVGREMKRQRAGVR